MIHTYCRQQHIPLAHKIEYWKLKLMQLPFCENDLIFKWLLGEVLKNFPHQQCVFSIPKRLRINFLYDRKLLSKLSRCGWDLIRKCLETTSLDEDAKPVASIAAHTYGDFLNFNPHHHAIIPDGYFWEAAIFRWHP
jgi:hypothetical protein